MKGKSTSGWVVFLAGGPVAWGVSLQSVTAQSTTEAEYIALNFCLKDLYWFKQLLEFLGHPQRPIPVMEDNSGAVDWAEGRMNHKRSKHVKLKYHWNQECIEEGWATMHHVRTTHQIADIFTKGRIAKKQFRYLRSLLMNCSEKDQRS